MSNRVSAVGRESSEDDGKRANSREKKTLKHQPTLGGRLRAGIGQVSGSGKPSTDGLMGLTSRTSLHYARCIKPNDGFAAFGYEQPRVLKQLQYSGILDMVRIRRQGFRRAPFGEFEARFGALLLGAPKGSKKDGGGMMGTMKRAVTRAAAYTDDDEAEEAAAKARKLGYGGCLQILQRANLFEHRHYQFGKTLLFLRNGVEGALLKAVASQMLAVTWFQKTARGRKAVAHFAAAKRAALILQKHGRRRVAYREMRKRRAVIRRRLHALRMGAHGAIIAKTLEKRVAGWIEPRRAAKIQCQRLARGHLARKKVAWLRKLANRAAPLNRLRWAFRVYMCFLPGLRYLMARAMAIRVQREARRIKATQEGRSGRRRSRRCRRSRAPRRQPPRRHPAQDGAPPADLRQEAPTPAAPRPSCSRRRTARSTRRSSTTPTRSPRSPTPSPSSSSSARTATASARRSPTPSPPAARCARRRSSSSRCSAAPSPPAARRRPRSTPTRRRRAHRSRAPRRDVLRRPPRRRRPHAAPLRRAGRARLPAVAHQGAHAAPRRQGAADARVGAAARRGGRRRRRRPRGAPRHLPRRAAERRVRRHAEKCLVVLGQTTLRLYTLPAGASDAAKAAEAAEAGGKPSLSLTCDKLLYRRSTERSKRDCIEVVIIKRQKAKLKQLAAFETQAAEDILEIYPTATGSTAAAEVRGWMAALHSPRYLLARGMHLVSHVSGGGQAASQLDVWGRWAVVNRRDGRGEALLHQALRGVVAGEEAERGRLVGWLCDQGAMLFDGADPIDDDDDDGDGKKKKGVLGSLGKSMRKMSLTPRADGSAQPARYGGSAFELLLQLASREGGDAKIDAAWASLLKLIVKQAAAMMSAADLEARSRRARAVGDAARRRARDARRARRQRRALARATAVTLAPPPPPSAAAQNRSLVLLTIARVDCGAAPLAATPDALCSR